MAALVHFQLNFLTRNWLGSDLNDSFGCVLKSITLALDIYDLCFCVLMIIQDKGHY